MSESTQVLTVITASFDHLSLALITALSLTALWLSPSVSLSEGTRRFCLLSVALTFALITACIELVMRTAALADVNLNETWPYIFRVLDHSDYGDFWQWQMNMWWLMLLLALWIYVTDWSRRTALILLMTAVATAWFESVTGHAGENGLLSVPNLINSIHLISSMAWGGMVIVYALLVLPDFKRRYDKRRVTYSVLRLSTLASVALALVLITGLFNTWQQLEHISDLWQTEYGLTLTVKLMLVAMMMAIGALNRFRWVPQLLEHTRFAGETDQPTMHFFQKILYWDSLVFVNIIIVASLLGTMPPPGHG